MNRPTLKDMVEALDSQTDPLELSTPQVQVDTLANSKNYHEIIRVLHEEPILVQPCLEWLELKLAEIANAKLNILFGPERVAKMKEQLHEG